MLPTADLQNAFRICYKKQVNKIWSASFYLPSDDPHADKCTLRSFAELFDGTKRVGLFRIIDRKLRRLTTRKVWQFTCEHVLSTLNDDMLVGVHNATGNTTDALNVVLGQQSTTRWVLGTCDWANNYVYRWEDKSLLEALLEIPKRLGEDYQFSFSTTSYPWTINLISPASTVTAYIDYSRNLQQISREEDTKDMYTRLTAWGQGVQGSVDQIDLSAANPTGKTYIDADTIGTYGVISRIWTDQRYTTSATLYNAAVQKLALRKDPLYRYSIKAADIYQLTGEDIDNFSLGSYVLITDEELGIDVSTRVVAIGKPDITGKPGSVTLQLANKLRDFVDVSEIVFAPNLDDVKDGSAFARVLSTSIEAGVIKLSAVPGGTMGSFPSPPEIAGLYLGATHLGYHDGSNWKTFMDADGNFYLGGTGGKLQWDAGLGTLTIDGSITATTGEIGGWVIGTYTLTADSGAVGLSSEATAGTDWRIWAGHATPASAPFRVDESGNMVAAQATITGGITITSGSGIASLSDAGALATEDDLDGVSNGTTYSRVLTTDITAGHILLSSVTQSATYRTTTDTEKSTWNGKPDDMDEIGEGITYGKVLTTDITAGHILLSAASGNLDDISDGSSYSRIATTDISAGHITVVSSQASININDTVFGNQGVQLQYNAGTPRTYVGDGSNAYVKFDGTKLTWKAANSELDASGNLTITSATVSGSITITGGSGIASLSDAGALATADDLDGVPDGATYSRVLTTDISAGHIVLSAASGDIDDISDGTTYSRVATTDITAGHITLVSSSASININNATFGLDGVQLQYNAGNPRCYIGNGSTKYFKFDGTNVSWKGVNAELTAAGAFTASNATITGNITCSGTSTWTGTSIGTTYTAAKCTDANADQTSTHTAADTSAVNGLASSSVAGWAHPSNTTKINGGDIYTGTVTANQITVTNLAALNANMGSITAGNITLNSSGYIKGGATGYNSGTGFWMGYSGGYKFFIGAAAGNKMLWTGAALEVTGKITMGAGSTLNGSYINAGTITATQLAANSVRTSELYIDGNVNFHPAATYNSIIGVDYVYGSDSTRRIRFGTQSNISLQAGAGNVVSVGDGNGLYLNDTHWPSYIEVTGYSTTGGQWNLGYINVTLGAGVTRSIAIEHPH